VKHNQPACRNHDDDSGYEKEKVRTRWAGLCGMQRRRRSEKARGHYIGMLGEHTLSRAPRLGIFQEIAEGKLFGAWCGGWLVRLS
jgi:hypothetical protein